MLLQKGKSYKKARRILAHLDAYKLLSAKLSVEKVIEVDGGYNQSTFDSYVEERDELYPEGLVELVVNWIQSDKVDSHITEFATEIYFEIRERHMLEAAEEEGIDLDDEDQLAAFEDDYNPEFGYSVTHSNDLYRILLFDSALELVTAMPEENWGNPHCLRWHDQIVGHEHLRSRLHIHMHSPNEPYLWLAEKIVDTPKHLYPILRAKVLLAKLEA